MYNWPQVVSGVPSLFVSVAPPDVQPVVKPPVAGKPGMLDLRYLVNLRYLAAVVVKRTIVIVRVRTVHLYKVKPKLTFCAEVS